MKIHILFNFQDGPSGGGSNQFLKTLRQYFIQNNYYTEDISQADVILLNSHNFIKFALKIKKKYPSKLIVHRIDGPMSLYNTPNDHRDSVVKITNELIADATIFQSKWSEIECKRIGLKNNSYETVIFNAPDPSIFNRENRSFFSTSRKIRLIATSWSSNFNKGFDVYKWLDDNLDFSKYSMTFVGNSPINFNNIEKIPPNCSSELALKLKTNDIFISGSRKESCSNAIIEALHCGLPVIAPNDSSNPEIIKQAGSSFNSKAEIPHLLDNIVNNYSAFQAKIDLPTLDTVGKNYYSFIFNTYNLIQQNNQMVKKYNTFKFLRILNTIFIWRLKNLIFMK